MLPLCAAYQMLEHPAESPTLCYSLNATTPCRISYCVLLTEYQHSIPTAGYRKKQHLTGHIVSTVEFDVREEHVILDVPVLEVNPVT
jgi:hypothetical protein